MHRRNNHENNNNNHRGRGRGRGRGGPNGVPTTVVLPATAPASRTPRHPYPHPNAGFDVVIQQWAEPPSDPGTSQVARPRPPRGDLTLRGMGVGRGRGVRGRGRGRGRELDNGGDPSSIRRRPHFGDVSVGSKARTIIGKDAPLSELLYSERPLLRPVKFVRATLNPFLSQQSEEVLKPASTSQAADTTETSHVLTADRIARLFHDNAPDSDSESQGHAPDALEEIDFADLAQIANPSHHGSFPHARDTIVVEEEVPRSSHASPNVSVEELSLSTAPVTRSASVPIGDIHLHPSAPPHDSPHPPFVADTAYTRPFRGRSASDVILVDRTGPDVTLGDQDEERIVYVALHTRSGPASPVPVVPRVKLPQMSMLTGRSLETGGLKSPVREDDAGPVPASDRDRATHGDLEGEAGKDFQLSFASLSLGPTTSASTSAAIPAHPSRTKAALRAREKEMRLQRQNKRSRIAFGAMVSEARSREVDVRERRRWRWETRWRGDSDVDWGTTDSEGDEELTEVSDDDELSPKSSFQVRLRRVRKRNSGQHPKTAREIKGKKGKGKLFTGYCSDELEAQWVECRAMKVERNRQRQTAHLLAAFDPLSADANAGTNRRARISRAAARLDPFVPRVSHVIGNGQDLVGENSQILACRNRKGKEAIFRKLHRRPVDELNVELFLDDPEFTTPFNKKKGPGKKGKSKQFTGYFSDESEAQWAECRVMKVERNQRRQTARLLAALDPLSANANAGTNGRARMSRRAMHSAARLDPLVQGDPRVHRDVS